MRRGYGRIGFVLGLVSVVGAGPWLAGVLVVLWVTRAIGDQGDEE